MDYFTFVIVPVALLFHMQLLPSSGTLVFVALPLLASAYGFCQAAAKTPDFFFTGFPSYWNIVAFYLYLSHLPTWVNGAAHCRSVYLRLYPNPLHLSDPYGAVAEPDESAWRRLGRGSPDATV